MGMILRYGGVQKCRIFDHLCRPSHVSTLQQVLARACIRDFTSTCLRFNFKDMFLENTVRHLTEGLRPFTSVSGKPGSKVIQLYNIGVSDGSIFQLSPAVKPHIPSILDGRYD